MAEDHVVTDPPSDDVLAPELPPTLTGRATVGDLPLTVLHTV